MRYLLLLFLFSATLFACSDHRDPSGYVGFLYTSNNASTGNGIIALGRTSNGTLTELPGSPYTTSGNGDAADGDFDTEWALRMVGDYLLAVNAGGNPVNGSISVFKVNRNDGSLTQVDQDPTTPAMDNMDSRGIRATSIAGTTSGGTTWVVVANQHSNPHYEMTPAKAVGTITSSPLRNLAVFTLNQTTGLLQFSRIGATYDSGQNGGPTTVEFNTTGTKLITSTWGVAHIMTPEQDLSLQKPGRLYVYSFAGGTLTQTGLFEETGVSGNIGISWSPTGQYIYMTNFNLHSSKEANSITVHDGTTGAKIQNFASGGRNDEACWTWVSLDKTKLFAASFAQNVVSVFDIGADNKLTKTLDPNFFVRGGGLPEGDTKDMYETPGNFLYVLGAFQSHSISIFKVAANGSLSEESGSPYRIPSSAGKTKDQQAFLGLTGFEK
jgi:hypothetical protein